MFAVGVEGGFWASDAGEDMGVVEGDGVGDFFEGDRFFVWIGRFDNEGVDGAGVGLFDLSHAEGLEAWAADV